MQWHQPEWDAVRHKAGGSPRGTKGSNPAPSSGESHKLDHRDRTFQHRIVTVGWAV